MAALLVFLGCESLQNAVADGETRTISFHHVHTKEDLTVTYKVNGRYDEAALRKINHLMRDWREQQPIQMDPHVIDLLWEVHREVGAKEPIWVVCGYRSPDTNAMLRRRSSGVAQHSQHMHGRAVDFYIPGVPLDQLRAAGLRAQRGGVGYYPSSNFVHLDTGSVRHWPRMPEAQLAAILAKGQLASHNASDDGRVKPTVVAQAERGGFQNFLSKLLAGRDEPQDAASESPAAAATASAPAQVARAGMTRSGDKPAVMAASDKPTTTEKPAKPAKPSFQVASAATKPATVEPAPQGAAQAVKTVRPAQAASLYARNNSNDQSANDIINQRGYWQGLPASEETGVTSVARSAPANRAAASDTTATVSPWPMPERGAKAPAGALAYAAQPEAALARPAAAAAARNVSPEATTIAAKRSEDMTSSVVSSDKNGNLVRVGDRFNDPWMRALMVTPSTEGFMRTTLYGAQDFRGLGALMHKPAAAVAMGFSRDPYPGLLTTRFTGNPVTFTPMVNFGAKTAALR
jgi:uncharacterized protein YcbK (DUF882 family)